MNGRYYAKRIISANYVPENVLDSKVDNFARIWKAIYGIEKYI